MGAEKTAIPEPCNEVKDMVWLAYASIGFSVAAVIFVGVTFKTDNVLLFRVVLLLSVLGMVTGASQRRVQDPLKTITLLGAMLSGLLSVLSIAFLVIFGLWE